MRKNIKVCDECAVDYITQKVLNFICIILNPWNNHINEKTSPTPQKEVHHNSQPTTPWSLKIKKSWKQKGPTLRRTTTGDVVMWFQCQPCHWRRVWPRWWMNRCIQGSNLCRCRTAMDGKGMEMDGWDGCWEVGCLGFRGFRFFFGFFSKKNPKKSWQMIGIGTVFFWWLILEYTVLVNDIIVKIHAWKRFEGSNEQSYGI